MPDYSQPDLTAADRLREVAAILTRGLLRWKQRARAGEIMPVSNAGIPPKTGLEVSSETSLSVSHGTRGLGLRDDGDDA